MSAAAKFKPNPSKNQTPASFGVKISRKRIDAAFDPAQAPTHSKGVTLMERGEDCCKWPLFVDGARLYCGADIELNSAGAPDHHAYCAHHADISEPRRNRGRK